ncbi:hypothetical protein EJA10_17190 [Mesobacillus subterraneus]|uniref:Uncharacterized protein n=1 Tax=Mesobacillus subterraneus TaxID=285983 RepID=A0A3R9EZB1_9BACI|nr:hypothetical protein EJA10_17190 [Mesobacillus subterraneus]
MNRNTVSFSRNQSASKGT